jgi:hypothetical protein
VPPTSSTGTSELIPPFYYATVTVIVLVFERP